MYLTDFGLARHVVGASGLTATGAFVGTIDYVAPEQARGDRVDARADVYSLGCVLFQALTGTVPFPADNDLAKLYAHGIQPPPSALERDPSSRAIRGRADAGDGQGPRRPPPVRGRPGPSRARGGRGQVADRP